MFIVHYFFLTRIKEIAVNFNLMESKVFLGYLFGLENWEWLIKYKDVWTNFFSDPTLGKKKELNEQGGLSEPDMEPETEPEIDEKEEEEEREGEEQKTEQEETTSDPVEK